MSLSREPFIHWHFSTLNSSAPHTLKASLMQERTKRSPCNTFHSAKDTAIWITSSRAFGNPALAFLKKASMKDWSSCCLLCHWQRRHCWDLLCQAGGWGGGSKNSSYSTGTYEPSFQQARPSRLISQGWEGKTGIIHQKAERRRMKARNTRQSSISCNKFSSIHITMRLHCLRLDLCTMASIHESLFIILPGFNQCW